MSKVNLITQSEYAKLRGVSEAAVSKAVKAGRISLVDGLIDPVVAKIQWQENSRARASNTQLALDGAVPSTRLHTDPADAPKNDDYMVSRTRRESAEAELAELRLAEQHGNLIRVDAVKHALANAFTATRDSLLQIPSRLSAVLAAESDSAKVQNMLYDEIHRALVTLASAPARIGKPESAVE